MPWISKRRQAELEEANRLAKAGRVPSFGQSASEIVNLMTRASGHDVDITSTGQPLFRPDEWVNAAFGPNYPLVPEALDRLRPDTGLPEPRQYQYPVAENLRYFQTKMVPWTTLKETSETPLFRACIEVKKAELTTLDWKIRVSPEAAEEIAKNNRVSKQSVESELREKYKDEIERLTAFWEMPDRRNGRQFNEWLSIAQEEQLVWDAIAIYPRRTYGGELLDLMLIDGSTIKPLLDEQGGRPEPPAPAYQQILYGFPRGEFTADTIDQDGKRVVPGGLEATQLIYRRRVPRLQTPYGYSPTEQALLDGLLYNKRFEWMLMEYTQGTQPVGWVRVPETSPWTARQILAAEREFNDRYSGMTAERQRHPFLPPGLEMVLGTSVEERYKSDYDLHLIKLVAMHFGLTVTELGFTEKGGLGSAGYHEGQQDVVFRKGLLPDTRWFAAMLTHISRTHLGMPPELEFAFLGLDDEDEAAADAVNENRVKSARMTLNEARVESGQPAVDIPEADMLMVQTARGVVFVDGASQLVPSGVMIEPMSEEPGADGASRATSGVLPGSTRSVAPKASKPKKVKKDLVEKHAVMTKADEVFATLTDDYPKSALGWVHNTAWDGPQEIALDQINWNSDLFTEAAKEPDRVDAFAAKIEHKESKGKHLKPVVVIQPPGVSSLEVPDGHHRSLAYKKLGRPLWGYIGHPTHATGEWTTLHDHQFTAEQSGSDTAKSLQPADIQREIKAYKRWSARPSARPFTFNSLTRELASDLAPYLLGKDNVVFKDADSDPKAPLSPYMLRA